MHSIDLQLDQTTFDTGNRLASPKLELFSVDSHVTCKKSEIFSEGGLISAPVMRAGMNGCTVMSTS